MNYKYIFEGVMLLYKIFMTNVLVDGRAALIFYRMEQKYSKLNFFSFIASSRLSSKSFVIFFTVLVTALMSHLIDFSN